MKTRRHARRLSRVVLALVVLAGTGAPHPPEVAADPPGRAWTLVWDAATC